MDDFRVVSVCLETADSDSVNTLTVNTVNLVGSSFSVLHKLVPLERFDKVEFPKDLVVDFSFYHNQEKGYDNGDPFLRLTNKSEDYVIPQSYVRSSNAKNADMLQQMVCMKLYEMYVLLYGVPITKDARVKFPAFLELRFTFEDTYSPNDIPFVLNSSDSSSSDSSSSDDDSSSSDDDSSSEENSEDDFSVPSEREKSVVVLAAVERYNSGLFDTSNNQVLCHGNSSSLRRGDIEEQAIVDSVIENSRREMNERERERESSLTQSLERDPVKGKGLLVEPEKQSRKRDPVKGKGIVIEPDKSLERLERDPVKGKGMFVEPEVECTKGKKVVTRKRKQVNRKQLTDPSVKTYGKKKTGKKERSKKATDIDRFYALKGVQLFYSDPDKWKLTYEEFKDKFSPHYAVYNTLKDVWANLRKVKKNRSKKVAVQEAREVARALYDVSLRFNEIVKSNRVLIKKQKKENPEDLKSELKTLWAHLIEKACETNGTLRAFVAHKDVRGNEEYVVPVSAPTRAVCPPFRGLLPLTICPPAAVHGPIPLATIAQTPPSPPPPPPLVGGLDPASPAPFTLALATCSPPSPPPLVRGPPPPSPPLVRGPPPPLPPPAGLSRHGPLPPKKRPLPPEK